MEKVRSGTFPLIPSFSLVTPVSVCTENPFPGICGLTSDDSASNTPGLLSVSAPGSRFIVPKQSAVITWGVWCCILTHSSAASFPYHSGSAGRKGREVETEKSHLQRLFTEKIKLFLTHGAHKKFSPTSDNFISKNVKQGSWLSYLHKMQGLKRSPNLP